MSGYLSNIKNAFGTLSEGLRLTFRYLTEATKSRTSIGVSDQDYFTMDKGIVTLQYPSDSFPVPDTGRYRLHNEMDDCIVCDKCAKICPVDCIEIDPIRAPEPFGTTSDGTPKRIHAAKFDIDMSKCCFCGLCTTVCPTECLTMTKVYDFSEYEVEDHIYSFSEMSLVEIAQKRKELEEYEHKKEQAKEKAATVKPKQVKPAMKPKTGGKPVVKPKPITKKTTSKDDTSEGEAPKKPRPKFKPKPMIKRKPKDGDGDK